MVELKSLRKQQKKNQLGKEWKKTRNHLFNGIHDSLSLDYSCWRH
jgi:hypothetical protein